MITHGLTEEWRSVAGYEGLYSVSTLGRVRSERGRSRRVGWILKPIESHTGYPTVTLYDSQQRPRSRPIHVVVAETFLGPRPAGREVNHIDSDRSNAQLSNLEYVDHLTNMRHAKDVGHIKAGADLPQAKLNARAVEEIRSLRGTETQATLACRYGVTQSLISQVQRGVIWRVA